MTLKYGAFLGAIVITTDNQDVIFDEGGGDLTATIAVGTYYVKDDGAADDLLLALTTALDAAGAKTYSASVSHRASPSVTSSVVTLSADSSGWNLQADDASTTFDCSLLGYSSTTHADVGNDIDSDISPKAVWVPDQPPSEDVPEVVANISQNRSKSGVVYTTNVGGPYDDRIVRFRHVDENRMLEEVNTSDPTATLESWFDHIDDGRPIQYHKATVSGANADLASLSSSTLIGTYVMAQRSISRRPWSRPNGRAGIYDLDFNLLGYVSS